MKKASILDELELPLLPNFLMFKKVSGLMLPIDKLKDSEMRELCRHFATAMIKRKRQRIKIGASIRS